ncbi:hypothetical protein FACS1894142_6160 [Spirochaetia bacterium]|nr:hypothetical protein FACS1894142_6160 [Spirochaetia bacterium]
MSRKITGTIPNRIAEDGTPILTVEAYTFHPAERKRGAGYQAAAYCERCRDWHYHGIDAEGPPKGLTHRVAHCHGRNQDEPKAYWLDYDLTVPPVTPDALAQNRPRMGLDKDY